MIQPAHSWKSILGKNAQTASASVFEHMVETGVPWPNKPSFCTENEGLPYEIVVTGEHPLFVSGLMKFNAASADWECHSVEPLVNEAPLSDWRVTSIDKWEGRDRLEGSPPRAISLINGKGKEIFIDCPAYITMRESVIVDKSFRFGLYMIASLLQHEPEAIQITEGPLIEAERRRRSEEDKNFTPEQLESLTVNLSRMKALLQGPEGSDFLTQIDEVSPLEFLDCYGYKITCDLAARNELPLPTDLYVFESVLGGYIPKKGDIISGCGLLYGLPLSLVSEIDPEKPVTNNEPPDPSEDKELLAFLETRPELPLSTKVIIGAFIRTGWEVLQAPSKFFSKMIPSFIARKPGGSIYAVYIDSRMAGKYEYPDLNKAELDEIDRRCKQHKYKNIRFRVEISEESKAYRYAIAPTGQFPHRLKFLMDVKKPSRDLSVEETLTQALAAFAKTVNTSDMAHISAWLDEDLHFTSQTLGTDIYGKITFLRYFTVALARWEENKLAPKAVTGLVPWKNRKHPCLALTHEGKITSVTVMRARNGFVTEMITLAENSCGKFIPGEDLPQESQE